MLLAFLQFMCIVCHISLLSVLALLPSCPSCRSRIAITVCRTGMKACQANLHSPTRNTSQPVTTKHVYMMQGFSDLELMHTLRPYSDAKVIHFNSIRRQDFLGISNEGAQVKFENRIKKYTSLWCCKQAHPGHIWYDMMWDVKGMHNST